MRKAAEWNENYDNETNKNSIYIKSLDAQMKIAKKPSNFTLYFKLVLWTGFTCLKAFCHYWPINYLHTKIAIHYTAKTQSRQ